MLDVVAGRGQEEGSGRMAQSMEQSEFELMALALEY